MSFVDRTEGKAWSIEDSPKEVIRALRLVQNLQGGTIHLSLEQELGGYREGDTLRLRATAPEKLRRDVGGAARLEVIGVSTDRMVVVQIDGGACLKGAPALVDSLFERV